MIAQLGQYLQQVLQLAIRFVIKCWYLIHQLQCPQDALFLNTTRPIVQCTFIVQVSPLEVYSTLALEGHSHLSTAQTLFLLKTPSFSTFMILRLFLQPQLFQIKYIGLMRHLWYQLSLQSLILTRSYNMEESIQLSTGTLALRFCQM